jgi:hypothetical protein
MKLNTQEMDNSLSSSRVSAVLHPGLTSAF